MTETTLNKWDKAISRLIELTQDGNINWKVIIAEDYLPTVDSNGAMLMALYEGKQLLLFKDVFIQKSGSFIDQFSGSAIEKKEYRPCLCIYDLPSRTILFKFPYSILISDLYKAATYFAANVDDFLNKLIDKN